MDEYDLGPSTRDRDIEMLYALRIGNLEESVRDTTMEETLYHIFKKFGRITVRVAGFGKSRHAFVNFESHDAAQDAHSRFAIRFMSIGTDEIFFLPLMRPKTSQIKHNNIRILYV